MKSKLNKKGFTLIEVVLVLAIGGLIFLLAFLAFQQASINRRDTQRRSDAGRIVSELENYKGDRGSYPDNSQVGDTCATTAAGRFGTFANTYLCEGGQFEGPQDAYTLSGTGTVGSALTKDTVRYHKDQNCDGGSGPSVEIGLEKGVVCRDNQ